MEQQNKYRVIVSARTAQMLVSHAAFLAQASPVAAERLTVEFEKAAKSLEQMPQRCPWLKGEYILLGEDFTEEQLRNAIHDSALENDLMSMPNGLDTLVGEGGCNISGGQKQRVAIARALIHNRSILLVDEGTSALDAQNADRVEKSLLANPNLTLILISHHLTPERKKQFDKVYELGTALNA